MPHVLGFKFETVDDEQRDTILNAIIDLFDEQMGIGEKVALSYKVEGKTARGKQKTEYSVEWLRAEPAPMLEDLGINVTQNSMLALIDRYAEERLDRLNQVADAIEQKRKEIRQKAEVIERAALEKDHEDALLDKWAQALDEPATQKPQPPNANADTDDDTDDDTEV
jgi:hypothetical protein